MDKETRQMFNLILDKFDSVDKRFDKVDQRMGSLENELKDFRSEMKDGIKGLDGKMDLIYMKLKSDINDLKNKPEQRYSMVKEE